MFDTSCFCTPRFFVCFNLFFSPSSDEKNAPPPFLLHDPSTQCTSATFRLLGQRRQTRRNKLKLVGKEFQRATAYLHLECDPPPPFLLHEPSTQIFWFVFHCFLLRLLILLVVILCCCIICDSCFQVPFCCITFLRSFLLHLMLLHSMLLKPHLMLFVVWHF